MNIMKEKLSLVKVLIMITLVLFVIFTITSCKFINLTEKDEVNIEELLNETASNMKALNNYKATYEISEKTSIDITNKTVEGEIINYNDTTKYYKTIVTNLKSETSTEQIEVYNTKDDKITSYIKMTVNDKASLWMSTESDEEIYDIAYELVNGFIESLDDISEYEEVTDEENNEDYYIVEVLIDSDNDSEYFDNIDSIENTEQGLVLTLYIDKEDKLIKKVTTLGEVSMKYTSDAKVEYSLELLFSDINEVEELEIPEEVINNSCFIKDYNENYGI